MWQLYTGTFLDEPRQVINLPGIVLADLEYIVEKPGWHYHENPHFVFFLQGNVRECNERENHQCSPGTLLFHSFQEAHYNVKQPGSRGFHIEFNPYFFNQYQLSVNHINGYKINDPYIKIIFRQIYFETRIKDTFSIISIDQCLLNAFNRMIAVNEKQSQPAWIKKVTEALHDIPAEALTWAYLSEIVNVHPVHLSREFPKYFKANVGEYLRMNRIEKAANLLSLSKYSITEIAYMCGFADQSHLIRCFKNIMGTTPFHYKNKINNVKNILFKKLAGK